MITPLKYRKKRLGSFHWKEGVWSSEVELALSPMYAKRYRWLLRNRNQRLIVWLNIVSWILVVFGTLDVAWNLGFSGTPFSWWNLLVIVAYLLVRQSVRVVADAPDELLDERLIAERDRSYLIAYRWFVVITAFVIGALFGVSSEEGGTELGFDHFMFTISVLMFIASALPSMALAWNGSVEEP